MGWFLKKQGPAELDSKTVLKWIFSLRNSSGIRKMRDMRKQVQAGMLNEIATHLLPIKSEADGEAAYLLVHIFSGRVQLPQSAILLEVKPEATKCAMEIFGNAMASPSPSGQFELTAVYNCVLEIANETVERHYENALILANHGVKHWPQHAEIWRQRGVIKLALHDYHGALADLLEAKALKPDMYWLEEPIAFAEQILSKTALRPMGNNY